MQTRNLRFAFVALAAAFLVTACGKSADHSDPKSVAAAAIEQYKAKSVDGLMSLIPEAEAAKIKDKSKIADRAFKDGWRMNAVNAWDGSTLELKEKDDRARVRFHDMSADEVAVVDLRKVDGKWYFKGIKSPSKKGWDEWGK